MNKLSSDQLIASPYSTFSTLRDHGAPIGTEFTITIPQRVEYWAPDVVQPARPFTRRAMACPWSPPRPPAPPMTDAEFFAAMFGEPGQ